MILLHGHSDPIFETLEIPFSVGRHAELPLALIDRFAVQSIGAHH